LCAAALLRVSALNLLANPSFEDASGGAPSVWATYADVAASSTRLPHSGARGANLTSTNPSTFGILYQRVYGAVVAPGAVYSVSAWARGGTGRVSVEFFDALGSKLGANVTSFAASDAWAQRFASLLAPPGAASISAVVGAEAGAAVLFDDASLDRLTAPAYAFDLARRAPGAFEGFGVNTWASMGAGLAHLGALGLRFIRATQDGDSVAQMQAMRALTRSLGIRQLFQLWSAPGQFTRDGMLTDVDGFAAYWVALVGRLAAEGVCPDFLDLMNEPDSGGAWSTGIAPPVYSELVVATRRLLDAAGFANVSIWGPGLVVLSNEPQWVSALSAPAAAALGRFASHAYDDGPGMPGAATMAKDFPLFADAVRAKSNATSLAVTEYATHNYLYNGYTYPDPDQTPAGGYSASDSLPFAVRVAENTLAMLNEGATSLFYWCAQDMGGKSWGYVDESGRAKPVLSALLNLYPRLAVGGRMLQAPARDADSDVTLGVFVSGASVLIAASNAGQIAEAVSLSVAGCTAGGLRLANATAMLGTSFGDPSAGEWDGAALFPALEQVGGALTACEVRVTLPALSTLAVELELVGA